MQNNPFIWDNNSDQPYIIKDKAYKKAMRKKHKADWLPLLWQNLFLFPLGILFARVFKPEKQEIQQFFGMGVNLDKGSEQQALIKELGCKNLLIRVPLSDIENLDAYVDFAKSFKNCSILINILQDRAHIDDHKLLKEDVHKIFKSFKGISTQFQIGNAINRTKWGFFSVKEYLAFYKVVFDLKELYFDDYKLLGPSVIDFEYHYTIRALFSKWPIYFDKVAALLYVDRRGAPENTQMVSFDTTKKIDFLYSLASLAKNSSNKLVVSEVNWPLSNTAPYAPTSETECVDEETYAQYMLRYYLLALGTQKVQTVYWHQLIASGYGLIDAREGLRKRPAFEVYKTMLKMLEESQFMEYKKAGDLHIAQFRDKNSRNFDVLWSSSDRTIPLEKGGKVFDMYGQELQGEINISESPIYAYNK